MESYEAVYLEAISSAPTPFSPPLSRCSVTVSANGTCLGYGLSCLPLLVAWQMALPQSIINRNVLARRLSHLSHMLNAPNGTRGNYIGACTRCCLSVCLSLCVKGSRTFTFCLSLPLSLSRCLSLLISLSLIYSLPLFYFSLLLFPFLSFFLCLGYKRNLSPQVWLINYITNIGYNIQFMVYRVYIKILIDFIRLTYS